MRIAIATANPAGSPWSGNPVTAARWAGLLRALGHEVEVVEHWDGEESDALVALHARRSGASIEDFATRRPGSPIVVALTGTDLYVDGVEHSEVRRSLERADRIVVLQRHALESLPPALRAKADVVYQSADPCPDPAPRPADEFRIAVVGHLRPVKDPFRAAEAVRLLPAASRARLVHVGKALDDSTRARAVAEVESNPRYEWRGEVPYPETRRLLASSHLVAITSIAEGSSNVLSEALADEVPIVSSRIGGIVGTLGEDHPGYFEPGDTEGLAGLFLRAESEPGVLEALAASGHRASELVRPERERESWQAILAPLALVVSSRRCQ